MNTNLYEMLCYMRKFIYLLTKKYLTGYIYTNIHYYYFIVILLLYIFSSNDEPSYNAKVWFWTT